MSDLLQENSLSSREFNQDVGKAKRAADKGPVVITDRGKPTHVLLSFDTFRQMSGESETIIDLLAKGMTIWYRDVVAKLVDALIDLLPVADKGPIGPEHFCLSIQCDDLKAVAEQLHIKAQ